MASAREATRGTAIPLQCLAPETLRASLRENIPNVLVAELRNAEAVAFLALFNRLPPRTDIKADGVLIASLKQASQVVMVFFRKGCMTGRAVLPRAVLEQIFLQIERSGA